MWILPKNLSLPASNGSTATVEMLSDLNEQSQACALSLSVRGTPSSLRTWSAKWKRDSWTQYLSGRMLLTSQQNLSAISSWISSRLPTPAKDSAMPEKDLEPKTIDTSGPIADDLFSLSGPDGSGLKTSKDTFRLDSPQSLPTWKKMVIQRRGEYSARLKSARLTSGRGCLSSQGTQWQTATTNMDIERSPEGIAKRIAFRKSMGRNSFAIGNLGEQIRLEGREMNWPSATVSDVHTGNLKSSQQKDGSMHSVTLPQAVEKMWPTTTTRDYKGCGNAVDRTDGKSRMDTLEAIVKFGPPAPVSPNTPGSRRESWATPRSGAVDNSRPNGQGGKCLGAQAKKSWRTPSSSECNGGQASPEEMSEAGRTVKLRYQVEGAKIGAQTSAKLNPRWVETLMGLPLGWTSPDAPASLIANWKRFMAGWSKAQTERTSCECAETELSPKPPNEPSELSLPKSKDMPGQTFLF